MRFCRLVARQLEIGRPYAFERFQDTAADLAGFGMTTKLFFGKDQFAIDRDVKNATRAGDQVPTADKVFDFAFVQNFVRQTDGNRLMSSSSAVRDDDIHSAFLHELYPFFALRPTMASL